MADMATTQQMAMVKCIMYMKLLVRNHLQVGRDCTQTVEHYASLHEAIAAFLPSCSLVKREHRGWQMLC